jgi:lipopolysaccharide export LptBFGC system permease protein LptF
MKTVRRLLHGEIITAVAFVAVGFLALFMFFDLVDELQAVAKHAAQGYQLQQALLYIALKVPEHLYQLLPLSVLIGCIFVMARLAQSSEFTILRTGGLDPLRALVTLLRLGVIFVGLTFVIGDYIAPWADRQAIQVKALYQGPARGSKKNKMSGISRSMCAVSMASRTCAMCASTSSTRQANCWASPPPSKLTYTTGNGLCSKLPKKRSG